MACIRKRRGKFVVDWRDGGGVRRWRTCDTRDEANDVLADAIREARQATDGDARMTVDAYAIKWLETIRATAKERTWENYESTYRLHIKPTLGAQKLRAVKRAHVKALLVSKLRDGAARESVKLMRATIGTMFQTAIDDGLGLIVNPAAKLGKALKLNDKPDTEDIKAMTREQVAAFLAVVPDRYAAFFMTLARTGLRLGEGLALQWDDLDLNGATARICRNLSRRRMGSPKGNRARSVDLSPELVATLRHALVARKRATLASGAPMPPWCFTTTTGTPLDEGRLRKVMTRSLTAAGLPLHFSPHCLRHTFASLLLADGESPQWVQEQLGHSSLELTMRMYGRWLPKKPIMGGVARLDAPNGGKSGSKIAIAGAHGNVHGHIQSADLPIPQKTRPCNWIRIGSPAPPALARGGCS